MAARCILSASNKVVLGERGGGGQEGRAELGVAGIGTEGGERRRRGRDVDTGMMEGGKDGTERRTEV